MNLILKLDQVCYRYENAKNDALYDISVEFETGKMYMIMGKSGAGKTTLLSLIAGLDLCTEGMITYKGQSMKEIDIDEYRAKNIGIIFQSYNLITNATALENVMLSMNIRNVKCANKKEAALLALAKVGIDEVTANRKILKLSGGEQQRVGIARALSHNPEIVIADEPTGNLDEETEKNIMGILLSISREENKCVIIVSHSGKLTKYADEIWGMNKGRLVFIK